MRLWEAVFFLRKAKHTLVYIDSRIASLIAVFALAYEPAFCGIPSAEGALHELNVSAPLAS